MGYLSTEDREKLAADYGTSPTGIFIRLDSKTKTRHVPAAGYRVRFDAMDRSVMWRKTRTDHRDGDS